MKLAERLKMHGLCNEHQLLVRFGEKGRDVYVAFRRPAPREVTGSATLVYSPSHKTDPEGPWYNYGRKSFPGRMSESMPLAIEWAAKVYGVTMASSPFDPRTCKIPDYVLAKAKTWARKPL